MELRPYQDEIVTQYSERLKERGARFLIQAPTGSGKTIMFSAIIKNLVAQYPDRVRFLIMAHRKELITQAKDKLLTVAPELKDKVGVYSASCGEKKEKQITIASPQTLIGHDFGAFSIVIIDECHRLPLVGKDSTYEKILDRLFELNIDTRLLGFTATPFRMGHGYIYGGNEKNWFGELNYSITIDYMQQNCYLTQDKYKVVSGIEKELKKVKKSMGEYNLTELTEVVTKKVHIESATDAIKKYAENRKHIVVFTVGIAHAEMLANLMGGLAVHSKLKKAEREEILGKFERGEVRFLFNVDILTEGYDCAIVDCIVLLRPSMSTALYVQMVGRGLRLSEGKENCLVLDIAGLYKQHGYYKDIELDFENKDDKKGKAPTKVCPECGDVVASQKMICECGYEFTADDIEDIGGEIKMKDHARDIGVSIYSATTARHIARSGKTCLKLNVKTSQGVMSHYYVLGRPSHEKKLTKLAKKYMDYSGDEITEGEFKALCNYGFVGKGKVFKSNGWTKLRGF